MFLIFFSLVRSLFELFCIDVVCLFWIVISSGGWKLEYSCYGKTFLCRSLRSCFCVLLRCFARGAFRFSLTGEACVHFLRTMIAQYLNHRCSQYSDTTSYFLLFGLGIEAYVEGKRDKSFASVTIEEASRRYTAECIMISMYYAILQTSFPN